MSTGEIIFESIPTFKWYKLPVDWVFHPTWVTENESVVLYFKVIRGVTYIKKAVGVLDAGLE